MMRPAPMRGALPTAIWMLRNALHPVPVQPHEKRPISTGWAKALPSRVQLTSIFDEFKGAGVGMALGPAANVVDFEIDGPGFELELPPTLGWLSARGSHAIFRWDKRLEGHPAVIYLEGGAAELRIGGEGKQVMSVCPPTLGTNRRRRTWSGVWEVASFPDALLRAIEKPVHAGRAPLKPVVPSNADRYVAAALRYEVEAVANAKEGTRNSLTNRAAYSLGTLVGAGRLDRESVEADLVAAAISVGLPEHEARATVKSGLDAGIRNPRQ